MRFLVTAGPTREYLDDVRFISNPSSGRMGFACAQAAAAAGHRVTLVAGPVELPAPPGVKTIRVTSALEMHKAAMEAFRGARVVIATAAVCDYRPAKRLSGKMKKGPARLSLLMVRNPDILAEMGRRKQSRILIGFALEIGRGRAGATEKRRRKNLDAIVLNSPSSFGRGRVDATLITSGGIAIRRAIGKRALAERLVHLAERLARRRVAR